MTKLSLIGRILFALPFGIFGLNHFIMTDFFTGLLTSFIPGGGYTVLFTGVLLLAACISILLNKFVRISCSLLAFMLLMFIFTIHIPQLFDADPMLVKTALMGLLKDTALFGGCLMIIGMYKPETVEEETEL
jgi:uncharacterized membrane protein